MSELAKAPIARVAKQEGAERLSEDAIVALTDSVEKYARELSKASIDLAAHADRKTVQANDVELAVKYFYVQ